MWIETEDCVDDFDDFLCCTLGSAWIETRLLGPVLERAIVALFGVRVLKPYKGKVCHFRCSVAPHYGHLN